MQHTIGYDHGPSLDFCSSRSPLRYFPLSNFMAISLQDSTLQQDATSIYAQLRNLFDWVLSYQFKARTCVLKDPSRHYVPCLLNHLRPVSILTVYDGTYTVLYAYMLYQCTARSFAGHRNCFLTERPSLGLGAGIFF